MNRNISKGKERYKHRQGLKNITDNERSNKINYVMLKMFFRYFYLKGWIKIKGSTALVDMLHVMNCS